ncbi:MAG: tripartite tricarboxylate transporter TctB family protein [Rectinemataceae bacterium]|nr:tripartite tricarboxylate transporter TctB family protein [Rectinemataceae bacterium]
MGRIDLICGLLAGAVSLLFYIGTLAFPDMSIGINPRAYPLVIIVASFALSLLLIVQGATKMRREKALSKSGEGGVTAARTLPRGRTAWYLVALTVGMLAYALSMEDLGYIIVTPFLTALTMWLFGERKPVKIVLVSVLVSIVLYWIFRSVFRVPLPRSFIW